MYIIEKETEIIEFSNEFDMREKVEELLEEKLGFFVSLQENVDDDEIEIYIHTDAYEDLEEEQLSILDEKSITEDDSKEVIEKLLNIKIYQN